MKTSSDTAIPNVYDNYYNDTEIPVIVIEDDVYSVESYNDYIIIEIENFVDTSYFTYFLSNDHVMFKGETNEITVAALLLDLVDGTSTTDLDSVQLSDSIIWSIIIGDEEDLTDGCITLSDFMNAFHDSALLTGSQKLLSVYLLRRYELNPYNVSVTNVSSGTPLVSWSNTSTTDYNKIRFFDTSYNEIANPIFVSYQTSYVIPAATWNSIKSGRSNVIVVVEGMNAVYPITYRYYSSPCTVNIP